MTDVVWSYLVFRYWRGIAWTFAWMLAFGAPTLVPIPVLGWFAPPLLFWVAVSFGRRRVQRPQLGYRFGATTWPRQACPECTHHIAGCARA